MILNVNKCMMFCYEVKDILNSKDVSIFVMIYYFYWIRFKVYIIDN